MLIQKYTVFILGKFLTISLRLTYHCIRKGLIILALKFSIISPLTKKLPCDVKRLKLYLGKYLHPKSLYTLEEYFKSAKS